MSMDKNNMIHTYFTALSKILMTPVHHTSKFHLNYSSFSLLYNILSNSLFKSWIIFLLTSVAKFRNMLYYPSLKRITACPEHGSQGNSAPGFRQPSGVENPWSRGVQLATAPPPVFPGPAWPAVACSFFLELQVKEDGNELI